MGLYDAAFGKPQAILSEEALAERNASKTEELVELSSRGKRSLGESLHSQCALIANLWISNSIFDFAICRKGK